MKICVIIKHYYNSIGIVIYLIVFEDFDVI